MGRWAHRAIAGSERDSAGSGMSVVSGDRGGLDAGGRCGTKCPGLGHTRQYPVGVAGDSVTFRIDGELTIETVADAFARFRKVLQALEQDQVAPCPLDTRGARLRIGVDHGPC